VPKRISLRGSKDALDLSGPDDELVPAELCLVPDPGSRLLAGGTVLVGGSPVRVLRLTRSGARQVADWWRGAPVSDNPKARTLARRLLDTGIANPDRSALAAAGREPHPAEVTVVVPVRDRHAELARCLAGLKQLPNVIVVDDCSGDPAAVASAAATAGARVLRRTVNGGPAAARNTGLAAADTPFVAFLDSDCVPRPGWLDLLLPHFTDPAVGAVAPRVVPHEDGRTWLARYEGASSTLDMGARASIVRPASRVGWPRPAGGCATSPPPPCRTSTGYGCGPGSPGARTTGPPPPCWNSAIRARCARCRPRDGPRRPGWPPWRAARRRAPS
jgi:hypothetical protein